MRATRQQRIVAFLEVRGSAKFPEICAHLECGPNAVCQSLLDALRSGQVRRSGSRRHYVYTLAPSTLRGTSIFNLDA